MKTKNETTKTTTTKTTTAKTENKKAAETTTIENSKKQNCTLDEIYAMFVIAIGGKPIKCNYSNAKSQQYCGLSDFSVNMKATGYNVYMSEQNAEIVKKLDNTIKVVDNTADNTKNRLRCKLIKFTDSEALKNAINAVVAAKKAV